MRKLTQKNIVGVINCISGLRVGGSDDLLQIGGTDLTCIKNPVTLQPYIPGSSMKGKMRSEMEKKLGKFGRDGNGNEPCSCIRKDCLVCRVFGPHKEPRHDLGPTRIIVRDALLLEGGQLELKPENIIDRKTGTALHPRKVERVVANSKFRLKIGIQIWDLDSDCSYVGKTGADAIIEFVKDALREMVNTGLGSGVSKGSGEIDLIDLALDGSSFSLNGLE
jgi:CRISPR-associated protein Csm3